MAQRVHVDCPLVFYCKFCRQAFLTILKLNQHAESQHVTETSSPRTQIFQNCKQMFCSRCRILFPPSHYNRHIATNP